MSRKMSLRSSVRDWTEWMKENVIGGSFWDQLKNETRNFDYRWLQVDEPETGVRAVIPILGSDTGDWKALMKELDIPYEEIAKEVEKLEEEDKRIYHEVSMKDNEWEDLEESFRAGSELWDDFREKILDPLEEKIGEAFDRLKPDWARGRVYLDSMEIDLFGLMYYEDLSDSERAKIRRELEEEQKRQIRRGGSGGIMNGRSTGK